MGYSSDESEALPHWPHRTECSLQPRESPPQGMASPLPDSPSQPPNILMVHPAREDIKICDFGFAQNITTGEPQYSKYGSPEFVSPEIIEQTPVSEASDIW